MPSKRTSILLLLFAIALSHETAFQGHFNLKMPKSSDQPATPRVESISKIFVEDEEEATSNDNLDPATSFCKKFIKRRAKGVISHKDAEEVIMGPCLELAKTPEQRNAMNDWASFEDFVNSETRKKARRPKFASDDNDNDEEEEEEEEKESTEIEYIGKLPSDIQNSLNLMKKPDLCKRFGVTPTQNFLVTGKPGNGKTLLAKRIARE